MYSCKKGVVFIAEVEVGLVCWPCFLKSREQGKITSWLNKKVILKLGSRSLYHAELYAKQLPCAYTFSICEILGLCHFCRLWGVKQINNSSEKGSKFSGEERMRPRITQALLHVLCVLRALPWECHSPRTPALLCAPVQPGCTLTCWNTCRCHADTWQHVGLDFSPSFPFHPRRQAIS